MHSSRVELNDFAKAFGIEWFSPVTIECLRDGVYQSTLINEFIVFNVRINTELLHHPVCTRNEYLKKFICNDFDYYNLRYFLVQFSILVNQIQLVQREYDINLADKTDVGPSYTAIMRSLGMSKNGGSLDSQFYVDPSRFQSEHFNQFVELAACFDLKGDELGSRASASDMTLAACDVIADTYNHKNDQVALAGMYAIEKWLASDVWQQLLVGFREVEKSREDTLALDIFEWYQNCDDERVLDAQEILEERFFSYGVSEDEFIRQGLKVYDGLQHFWTGLLSQSERPYN